MDYQRYIDVADNWITGRPGAILLVFFVLTVVFMAGLGNIQTEAGTEQFAEDVPAEEAFQRVTEEFGPRFAQGQGSTQLIQSGTNVLSQKELIRMLTAQYRLEQSDGLRVSGTSSAASIVAQTIDPSATTTDAQINVLERSSERAIDRAIRTTAEQNDQFTGLVSTDFNPESASASATIGIVQHELPAELGSGAGTGGTSPLTGIQVRSRTIVNGVGGDIRVFGTGTIADEFSSVIIDSLILTVPAAVLFIVLFLVIAYRDLVDLLLGIVSLGMAIVWTFGFMGLVGISFNQILIAVPPLLLAVGIDFGIHGINRYREERAKHLSITQSIENMTDQIVVAFFIVTATTVIGFASNLSSALIPIRDFGVVASIGILFTFLIFGVYLPASKVYVDRLSERYPIPVFSQTPLGAEGSRLGTALSSGVVIARNIPVVFLVVVLVFCAATGAYATDIDTSFAQEDFLPPEETPAHLAALPEPFRPAEYSAIQTISLLEDKFESSQEDTFTIFVEGPLEQDHALEMLHRASENPPESVVSDGRFAETESIVTVIESRTVQDPEFRDLVARNDRDGNGIPDRNLDEVYDALATSPGGGQAGNYLTDSRRSTRIVYSVKSDASQAEITADARDVATRYRYHAIATGNVVVFQAISDLIFESAVTSLLIALSGAVVFLVVIYWLFEGRPLLGIANAIPVVITVALLAGTMRAVGISFNAFTATVLAITIGLGIDYSVHIVHRFIDEYRDHQDVMRALEPTMRGTGGALTGSMLTTVFGIGVLTLAVFPAIGQFGVLTGISILYAYLSSLLVLPSILVVWARWDRWYTAQAR